jgi:hypothetical protein
MGLWGTGSPKFVGTGTPDSNTVTLDYAVTDFLYIDPRFVEHVSVVDGQRNWIQVGNHSEFTVRLNVYKYTTSPTPKEKFQSIMTYLGQDVLFYPHSDGNPIKNSSSVNVNFTLVSVVRVDLPASAPFNTTADYKDVLVLTFKSKEFTDVTKSLV